MASLSNEVPQQGNGPKELWFKSHFRMSVHEIVHRFMHGMHIHRLEKGQKDVLRHCWISLTV